MKVRVTHRQPSPDGEWNSYEWSAEIDARDWEEAYQQARLMRRLIDGIGNGMNDEQREILGEVEDLL